MSNNTIHEEWRDVEGFTEYKVSSGGHVQSSKTGVWKTMSPSTNQGYKSVSLRKDGKYFPKRVHRLVLETFVGPCPAGMEGCHNNGDRSDNRLENLRWDTPKNNAADKKKHGTSNEGDNHPLATHTEEQVARVKEVIVAGASHVDIARVMEMELPLVLDIHAGRLWACVPWPHGLSPTPMKADKSRVGAPSSKYGHQGEKNHKAKISKEQALAIRKKLADGVPRKEVEQEFSVSRYIIYALLTGESWPDVWPEGVTPEMLSAKVGARFRDAKNMVRLTIGTSTGLHL